jgi:HSP20 family protein
MTIIRRPSPFGELMSLRTAMDRLLEESFVRPTRPWFGVFAEGLLPLDVRSDRDQLTVQASLPGVRPDDVEITIEQGTLTIRAESKTEEREETGEYLVQEIRRGELSRTVTLPSGLEAERATASFENGVLTLRIPRAEEVKPRQIRITPSTDVPSTDVPSNASDPGSEGATAAGTTA